MSSSSARRSYDTDSIVLRRMYAYDLSNNPFSTGYVLTSLKKGVVTFQSINLALSTIGVPNLPDELSTLAGELVSAITVFGRAVPSSPEIFLPSTVKGLGTSGYVSSPTLQSSLVGLGTLGYISSSQLTSTVYGITSQTQVTTGNLLSTVEGLGSANYVSTDTLFYYLGFLVDNLASAGYVSSTQLFSTVEGLGSAGYISSPQLLSTVEGLGSANYVSSSQLLSTIEGLGSAGYVSSGTLVAQGTIRSSFATTLVGNYSNVGFLYSNIAVGSNWRTIEFTFGSTFVQKIADTSKLDIEFTPNVQFAYYNVTSRNYSFSTFLVAGGAPTIQTQPILATTTQSYYIENANAINLPFFFRNSYRFQLQDPTVFSTIRGYATYSTFTLWHNLGNAAPTTNQFFASPDQPTCVNAVLDNSLVP